MQSIKNKINAYVRDFTTAEKRLTLTKSELIDAFREVAVSTHKFTLENAKVVCGKLEDFPKKIFIGGCGKPIKILETFACVDCVAPFHRKCLLKHLAHDMEGESLTKMPLEEALQKLCNPTPTLTSPPPSTPT